MERFGCWCCNCQGALLAGPASLLYLPACVESHRLLICCGRAQHGWDACVIFTTRCNVRVRGCFCPSLFRFAGDARIGCTASLASSQCICMACPFHFRVLESSDGRALELARAQKVWSNISWIQDIVTPGQRPIETRAHLCALTQERV